MALKPLIVTALTVGLFALMLFAFATEFITINNPSSPLITNGNYYYQSINSSLGGVQTMAQQQYAVLQSDKPSPIMIFLILVSVVTIPFKLAGAVFTIGTSVIGFTFTTLLGAKFSIVFAVINTIIIISIIFAIIYLIRSGAGEK